MPVAIVAAASAVFASPPATFCSAVSAPAFLTPCAAVETWPSEEAADWLAAGVFCSSSLSPLTLCLVVSSC
jgi:hypothetical protein